MTKNTRIIPHIPRSEIYGWYESPDRVTGSEFSNIGISRLWMYITETGSSYDLGSYARSQVKVRRQVSQITSGIPLPTALAITLHPEA